MDNPTTTAPSRKLAFSDVLYEFMLRQTIDTPYETVGARFGISRQVLGEILLRRRGRQPRTAHFDFYVRNCDKSASEVFSEIGRLATELETRAGQRQVLQFRPQREQQR